MKQPSKVIVDLISLDGASICGTRCNHSGQACSVFSQSRTNPKPSWLGFRTFSRAWRRLQNFTSTSDWFISFGLGVIGQLSKVWFCWKEAILYAAQTTAVNRESSLRHVTGWRSKRGKCHVILVATGFLLASERLILKHYRCVLFGTKCRAYLIYCKKNENKGMNTLKETGVPLYSFHVCTWRINFFLFTLFRVPRLKRSLKHWKQV